MKPNQTFEKLLVDNFAGTVSIFTNDANKYPFKIATMTKTLLYNADNAQADAEFIARAVNSHGELVRALETAINAAGELGTFGAELQNQWRELLKRAE